MLSSSEALRWYCSPNVLRRMGPSRLGASFNVCGGRSTALESTLWHSNLVCFADSIVAQALMQRSLAIKHLPVALIGSQ